MRTDEDRRGRLVAFLRRFGASEELAQELSAEVERQEKAEGGGSSAPLVRVPVDVKRTARQMLAQLVPILDKMHKGEPLSEADRVFVERLDAAIEVAIRAKALS